MHEPEEHPAVRAALDLLEWVAETPMLMASHRVAARRELKRLRDIAGADEDGEEE